MDISLRQFWTTFSEQTVKFRRNKLFWVAVALGAVILLAIIASYFIGEPLRRQTEAKINRALKGYTVRIGRLDFHPIGFSLDLEDMLIIQNAAPDPPVAQIPNLSARVDWKALLFGRVVAYFEIDDPVLSIDLMHFERERRDETKLHQRGWQGALQAIYPLEINEFVVSNARLTYTDRGPYRPLELRDVNLVAHNIRNVRSSPGEYPSPVHLDGAVFEKGRVDLDGYADFLAEPHVAFKADVAFNQLDLSYFRPITDRYHFDVRSGVFSTKGTMEYAANKKVLDVPEVRVDRLIADYIHTKPETAPTEEISRKTDRVIKETSNEPGLDVRLGKIQLVQAELGMINKAANPEYRLFVAGAQIQVGNLSNQQENGVATARATGLFMGSGKLRAAARFVPKGKRPNFDFQLTIEDADLKALNKLFLSSGGFDVAGGRFSLYTEMRVRDGVVDGYVKPLFRDVDVYDPRQDRNKSVFRKIYEGVIGGLSWLLENPRRDEVATTTRISGKLSNPQTSTWEVIVGLVQNAFFRAILPGLERSIETDRKARK